MSKRKPRKFKDLPPRQKPTLHEFFTDKIMAIRNVFTKPMRVTIIARDPTTVDADLVFSDDDIDQLIALLQKRRDTVMASQRAGEVL